MTRRDLMQRLRYDSAQRLRPEGVRAEFVRLADVYKTLISRRDLTAR